MSAAIIAFIVLCLVLGVLGIRTGRDLVYTNNIRESARHVTTKFVVAMVGLSLFFGACAAVAMVLEERGTFVCEPCEAGQP